MHGCREGVVAALAHVDMVIRVDNFVDMVIRVDNLFVVGVNLLVIRVVNLLVVEVNLLVVEYLHGPSGKHFISVHVGLSATACLPHHQGELLSVLVVFVLHHFTCCLLNGFTYVYI
jgi:hypothetical protein